MTNRPPESPARPEDEDTPKICYCMHVHEATILRAIREGATTLAELGERTRAGTGCGTCKSELVVLLSRRQT